MIYNEGSEEEVDWWESGKKKKTKESIFYHISDMFKIWPKVMIGKKK